MARIDLSQLSPLAATPSDWLETVLADFDGFLMDHASAEKKASGMAMSMISHYPDQPSIVRAMVELAVEELNHYREVMRLILERQLTPTADLKDPYIHALNGQVRKAADGIVARLHRLHPLVAVDTTAHACLVKHRHIVGAVADGEGERRGRLGAMHHRHHLRLLTRRDAAGDHRAAVGHDR